MSKVTNIGNVRHECSSIDRRIWSFANIITFCLLIIYYLAIHFIIHPLWSILCLLMTLNLTEIVLRIFIMALTNNFHVIIELEYQRWFSSSVKSFGILTFRDALILPWAIKSKVFYCKYLKSIFFKLDAFQKLMIKCNFISMVSKNGFINNFQPFLFSENITIWMIKFRNKNQRHLDKDLYDNL